MDGFLILILEATAVGMAAGWLAQIVIGHRRGYQVNYTEAFIVGILGSFAIGTLSSLIAGDGFDIGPAGFLGTIVGAFVVQIVYQLIRPNVGRGRRQRAKRTTPEGLPGHHQPQKHHPQSKHDRRKRRSR